MQNISAEIFLLFYYFIILLKKGMKRSIHEVQTLYENFYFYVRKNCECGIKTEGRLDQLLMKL